MAGSFRQEGVAHRPCVPCAARRAKGAHVLLADAQKGADLAPDAAVDLASGGRAHEEEMFDDRSRAELATPSCRAHDRDANEAM
jgi:hypothetical protein